MLLAWYSPLIECHGTLKCKKAFKSYQCCPIHYFVIVISGSPFLCMVINNVTRTMSDFTSFTTSAPGIATRQVLFPQSS